MVIQRLISKGRLFEEVMMKNEFCMEMRRMSNLRRSLARSMLTEPDRVRWRMRADVPYASESLLHNGWT